MGQPIALTMNTVDIDHLQICRDLVVRTLRESYGVRVQPAPIKVKEVVSPRYIRLPLALSAGEDFRKLKAQEKHVALLLKVDDVEIYSDRTGVWCIWPRHDPQDVHLASYLPKMPAPAKVGTAAIGIAMDNTPVAYDLAHAPHTLVVGASGAGKTVIQRTIITSMAYWWGPEAIQLVLCDGKGGESFDVYQASRQYLGHLLWPIAHDVPEMAVLVSALSRIMLSRLAMQRRQEWRPLIFLVVDELANIVALAGKEIEQQVKQILYLGRSAGIHVVAATQKADTAAIRGLNSFFVGRVVLRVVTANDAYMAAGRGQSGAHRLSMQGDMLVGENLDRTQGFMVADADIQELLSTKFVAGTPSKVQTEPKFFVPDVQAGVSGRPLANISASELESAKLYIGLTGDLPSINGLMKGRVTGAGMGYGRAVRIIHQLGGDSGQSQTTSEGTVL